MPLVASCMFLFTPSCPADGSEELWAHLDPEADDPRPAGVTLALAPPHLPDAGPLISCRSSASLQGL